jgi:hypothetical protein
LTNTIREIGGSAAGRKRFTAHFGAVIARFDQDLVAGGRHQMWSRTNLDAIGVSDSGALCSFATVKGATLTPLVSVAL